ncbi:MAG: D-sedoheptulose 7-phosphate isomerase [Thermodesulfobacteriota bacterium]
MIQGIIQDSLRESIEVKRRFAETGSGDIIRAAEAVAAAFKSGGKLLICGNGGSAADAQHVAAEFVNRFLLDRRPLPAIALTTDSSVLTSIGNDFSYEEVFAKQVRALAGKGDILLAISTSGNSPNVLRAILAARQTEAVTVVGLTGEGGGRMASLCDILIAVPSRYTPAIQESHLWAEHLLCQLVDEMLFGRLSGERA